MPRLRPLHYATIAIAAGAILAVLYVILGRPVHAPGPPASLARLERLAPVALPDAGFNDAQGARRTLAGFRGRYVLLNLWATWCAPCVRELPALARLQAAVPGMSVVAVNVWHSNTAETTAFLKAHDAAALTPYFDPHTGLMTVFGQVGLPYSVLIDPQGREVARALGPAEWDDPDAIAWFQSLSAHAAS